MLKTCPLDSKTTRTDRRKFIHSWILLYCILSFLWDKELQHPTGKWTCDNNFEFSVSDAARRWQCRCSQRFTCHSMELLLLPTTHSQLCIWCESCWLNRKSYAIFPTLGMYICWRWCSKALFRNATFFSRLRKKYVLYLFGSYLKSHHQALSILFHKYWAEASASMQLFVSCFFCSKFQHSCFHMRDKVRGILSYTKHQRLLPRQPVVG